MTFDQLTAALSDRFGEAVVRTHTESRDPYVVVAADSLAEIMRTLRDEPPLAMDTLSNLCGVDYLEPEAKLAKKFPYEPHIEVVYHLFSLTHRHRLTVKVELPRPSDAHEQPSVPSVASIWTAADWRERECFDLYGIRFAGHPNLERILCPDDWVGHPLRKDYEMPLEYDGIRGR